MNAARRTALLIGTTLVSINVWTGCPLLALWVGSQVQGSSTAPKMGAVAVVVVVLAVSVFAAAWLLALLNCKYDEITGRPRAARQPSPWLRSMRGEREADVRREHGISGIERVVLISVVAAVLAFEVWFFFFAGSSLPSA